MGKLEASKKPRGQQEARKKPARGQQEASSGGVFWRDALAVLWRGALAGCSGGVLWQDALAGKPARCQEKASKKPARS